MSHPVPAPDSGPDAGAVWHYGDPLGEQRAAETDAIVIDRSHRGVLTLTGNDRQTWLHSISTQHVSNLPEGASTQNLSLDGQGRVEDHWIQTELGGTTYLDTEPWRAEPLLEYLRKMVFWSEVTPTDANLAVLSLLGPRLADQTILDALGVDALPAELSAVPLDGGFVRRMPGTPAGPVELDLVVPRADAGDWRNRLSQAGVRPGGVWAYEAHRVAAVRPRLGVDTDERTIPHEVGWIGGPARAPSIWTKAVTAGKRPSRGCTTWAGHPECWCCCTWTARWNGRRRASRCWPADVPSAASAPWSITSTSDRSRWRCSSAGCPPRRNWRPVRRPRSPP